MSFQKVLTTFLFGSVGVVFFFLQFIVFYGCVLAMQIWGTISCDILLYPNTAIAEFIFGEDVFNRSMALYFLPSVVLYFFVAALIGWGLREISAMH